MNPNRKQCWSHNICSVRFPRTSVRSPEIRFAEIDWPHFPVPLVLLFLEPPRRDRDNKLILTIILSQIVVAEHLRNESIIIRGPDHTAPSLRSYVWPVTDSKSEATLTKVVNLKCQRLRSKCFLWFSTWRILFSFRGSWKFSLIQYFLTVSSIASYLKLFTNEHHFI